MGTQFSQLKLTDLVNKIYEKIIAEFNQQNEPKNEENTNNSTWATNKEKPKKKALKAPFKKTLIRTQIRIAGNRQKFVNAPWILNDDIAQKYNISTEMPQNLKLLITEYLNKRNKHKNKNIKPLKPSSSRKPKDDQCPKRPISSYFLFANDVREKTKSEFPTKSMTEIGREISKKWKLMSK